MIARIPTTFDRVAAAFNEASRNGAVRLCESSGSEHSPDDFTDLSDLVDSFIETDWGVENNGQEMTKQENERDSDDSENYWPESETIDLLRGLLLGNNSFDGSLNDDEEAKQKIHAAIEIVRGDTAGSSSQGFKRRIMSSLRVKGFDAGLCKSRWEKFGRHPAGSYEYVDVKVGGTRYIVEVNLEREFEIARPTPGYLSLLDMFPGVFIGTAEQLKQIVRIMCTAIRESMKSKDMPVPPWRRNGYVQAKWSASYKRTISAIPGNKAAKSPDELTAGKRSVGFQAFPKIAYGCRYNYANKARLKVGLLTAAFTENTIGM